MPEEGDNNDAGAAQNDAVPENAEANPPAPAAEPAKGEADKPEEKKNLIPKNPFDEEPYVPSEATDPDMYNLSPCCCCMCACSHDRVGDATCFGCLPIKCGVMFIAI
jgi:hypothetical protein